MQRLVARTPLFSHSSPASVLRLHRSGLTSQGGGRYVLGCGSNVVDHIYNVQVVPRAGEKGFFKSNFKALEKKLIGGVTLNHLSWAALGGVSTGLLALQGDDDMGRFIRSGLKDMNVSTEFIRVDESYSTAQCHVFIQEGGERSILMAPAATSLIDAQAVTSYFDPQIQSCAAMVTTEISQVPLTGVLEILKSAKRAGVLSVLDLDVPPTVAVEEAKLGTLEQVIECVKMADILKPAKAAAQDVLHHLSPSTPQRNVNELAPALVELCGSKLVALTDGAAGSVIATADSVVMVEAPQVRSVVDTTGAGDAFLGGLICGITSNGLPSTISDIEWLGTLGNAFGAACVQSVGGVPVKSSRALLQEYLPQMKFCEDPSTSPTTTSGAWLQSLDRDSRAATDLVLRSATNKQWNGVVTAIDQCAGRVFVSGLGKSGRVADRLAASLSSVGIPAEFVHASEWTHGDLGKSAAGDVCVFLSHSGETVECVSAASHHADRGVAVVAITGTAESALSKLSTAHLSYSNVRMEEPFGVLPTSSIVIQEMVCNALLCELVERRGVTKEDFKNCHPGGAIGAQLSRE